MSRVYLAFASFFSLLFRGRLPEGAKQLLPAPEPALEVKPEVRPEVKIETKIEAPRPAPEPAPAPVAQSANQAALRTEGALMLLTLLQREGRLLDFLRESLDGYDDASIGVAVRDVHRDCRRALDEHLKLEPVMPGEEEASVTVPKGFDPGEVRLIGKVEGEPPFKGVLVHHGWRVVDAKFPSLAEGVDRHVIAPAEVKVA
jgi:hypothetical protein